MHMFTHIQDCRNCVMVMLGHMAAEAAYKYSCTHLHICICTHQFIRRYMYTHEKMPKLCIGMLEHMAAEVAYT